MDLNRTERLQPSLLDRLTDLAPDRRTETLDQQVLTMAQLRRAVLRDLGWLLNATNLEAVLDLPGEHTRRSTLNYGIPGVAGTDAATRRASALETHVADAIRAFEPRIRPETLNVRARPMTANEGLPVLTLEISGELWAQPVPVPVFFETAIELETRTAIVIDGKTRP